MVDVLRDVEKNKLPRSKLSRLALDFHFVEAGYYTASYKRLRAQTKNLRSKLRGIKPEEIKVPLLHWIFVRSV